MSVLSTSLASDSHFGGVHNAADSRPNWSQVQLREAGLVPRDDDDEVAAEGPSSAVAASIAADSSPRAYRASAVQERREPAVPDTREARRERLLHQLATSAAPRGFRIARDLLGSRDAAEDAVQEALARACEQCDRIRDLNAAEGWFYRVLTNLCLRTLRRRRLRRLILGRERPTDEHRPSAPQPLADRQLAHTEDVAQLMTALDGLPSKQRAALLLRYGHDLGVAEIADMLAVRPATVKTHLVRGLRRLRKKMERNS